MLICVPMNRSKTQYYINQAYADYVMEAGYQPMMAADAHDPLVLADACDGLLLPGGIDIDPIFYDEENIRSYSVEPEKDDFERALLHAFVDRGKPIFGICRGFQLILREYFRIVASEEVWKSCTYYQHINGHSLANELDLARHVPSHSVWADRSFLYGEKDHKSYVKMYVNSMHHQGIVIGPIIGRKIPRDFGGLVLTATTICGLEDSKKLGNHRVAEAVAIDDWGDSRIAAVQWHPEELRDVKLLKTFFDDKNGKLLLRAAKGKKKKAVAKKAAQPQKPVEQETAPGEENSE